MPDPFSVVAAVTFNNGEGLVLNRQPKLIYEPDGQSFIGRDGPFMDYLAYERARGSMKAFGGRTLTITLADGTTRELKDHWWAAGVPGVKVRQITYNTIEELKKCYVYYGKAITAEDYDALRACYEGCTYPYYDYEKIIKFDDMRRAAWDKQEKLERRAKHLISEVKWHHRLLDRIVEARAAAARESKHPAYARYMAELLTAPF